MLWNNHNQVMNLVDQAKNELISLGLPTQVFVNENFEGYTPVTKNVKDTVYTLYIDMGESPNNSNNKIISLGQVFWKKYPNLSLVTMIEVDANGVPTNNQAVFNTEIDSNFSNKVLPVMYTAFNSLDPKMELRGQVVQRYTRSKVLFEDLIPASLFTLRLLLCTNMTGQIATVTGDFSDLFTRIIAFMLKPITSNPANKVVIIPAKRKESSILVPVPNINDSSAAPYTITSTVAIDECFKLALDYVDDHILNQSTA